MHLDKINDDSFKCILSKEDLESRNLSLDDFIKNSDKIQDLLHEVMDRAHEEFGFEAKTDSIALRMMPMPDGQINLVFMGGSPETQITEFITELMKAAGGNIDKLLDDAEIFKKGDGRKKDKAPANTLADITKLPECVIMKFDKLDLINEFCKRIYTGRPINSDLYKDTKDGNYYLIIRRIRISRIAFSRILNVCGEYGDVYGDDMIKEAYVNETMEKLVMKKAVKVFAEM